MSLVAPTHLAPVHKLPHAPLLCCRFLDQERQEIEYTLRVLQQEASPYKM